MRPQQEPSCCRCAWLCYALCRCFCPLAAATVSAAAAATEFLFCVCLLLLLLLLASARQRLPSLPSPLVVAAGALVALPKRPRGSVSESFLRLCREGARATSHCDERERERRARSRFFAEPSHEFCWSSRQWSSLDASAAAAIAGCSSSSTSVGGISRGIRTDASGRRGM